MAIGSMRKSKKTIIKAEIAARLLYPCAAPTLGATRRPKVSSDCELDDMDFDGMVKLKPTVLREYIARKAKTDERASWPEVDDDATVRD